MSGRVVAVSGIDTGVGKTVATGWLARTFSDAGVRTITQKIAQTGVVGISEDIAVHRELMGIGLQPADLDGTTCPYVFRHPASPHLAAAMEGGRIDVAVVRRLTFRLQQQYELVILEGAGGLLVPLDDELLYADYLRDAGYGLVLVTSPRLGSINHTLLSLEACLSRGIPVSCVLYNRFGLFDEAIAADTRQVISHALQRYGMQAVPLVDLGVDGFSDADRPTILNI